VIPTSSSTRARFSPTFWYTSARVSASSSWPIGLDKTLWEGIQYFLPPRNAGERFSQEFGQVLQRNAWLEDTGTMEATQLALSSGVKKFFHLQDGEVMLRHNYQVIDEFVNRP
jgi:hypothetical protein